jgi:hypothetical protein
MKNLSYEVKEKIAKGGILFGVALMAGGNIFGQHNIRDIGSYITILSSSYIILTEPAGEGYNLNLENLI